MTGKKVFMCIFMICFFLRSGAQNPDIDIAKSINPQNPNSGYWKTTSAFTYYISGAVPVVFMVEGFIKNDPAINRKSYELFSTLLIDVIVTEALKESIDRKRPSQEYPLTIFPYRDNIAGRSLPSGHTSLAFATAASLSIQCKKWYVTLPAYAWAASVGYSRLYLGVHYPSDVLAGAAVGVGSAYLSNWINKKIFYKEKSSAHIMPELN